jgi:hypothetical protein
VARKLWLASRILGGHSAGGPFGKPLPEHTPAELDFILEMGAADEPDRYTFLRGGREPRRAASQARAAWHAIASGRALETLMARDGVADAQRRLAEYKRRQGVVPEGLKPGFTRGGKPIDA